MSENWLCVLFIVDASLSLCNVDELDRYVFYGEAGESALGEWTVEGLSKRTAITLSKKMWPNDLLVWLEGSGAAG